MKPVSGHVEYGTVEAKSIPECPDCGSVDTNLRVQEQSFRYGREPDAVELKCEVPVYTCNKCGCEWTAGDAEEARTLAIYKHLRRLTPREVRSVREACQLSQAEFSRITGFGEASLSRWETGVQIQNVSSDRLLRLIALDRRNLHRLEWIEDKKGVAQAPTFRALVPDAELRRRQATFQLHRAS